MGLELQPLSEKLRVFAIQLETVAEAARERLETDDQYQQSEWYGLLSNKLLPQLTGEPFLVVSIVGGTNTGKTTIFNHLAGEAIGEANPHAGFTRYPVCLVPTDFAKSASLHAIFPGFQVAALPENRMVQQERLTGSTFPSNPERFSDADNLLFTTIGDHLPANLLLLDTPDIDSVVTENLLRASMICQASDVLIGVLTDQKYNDAAVKMFFREAARQKKSVIVVFSKLDWPDPEKTWEQWLKTFVAETEVNPLAVFAVPRDSSKEKRQLRELKLEFIPLAGELSEHTMSHGCEIEAGQSESNQLVRLLSDLHFSELKLRATRGALESVVLGSSQWLAGFRNKAESLRELASILENSLNGQRLNWPAAPRPIVIETLWKIWSQERAPLIQRIHWGYGKVGEVLLAPAKWLTSSSAKPASPVEQYRRDEWQVMSLATARLFEEMDRATTLVSERAELKEFQHRLKAVLSSTGREKVLKELQESHQQCDLHQEIQELVERDFHAFLAAQPGLKLTLQVLDQVAAFGRVGVTFASIMFVPGLVDVATQGVMHLTVDAAATAGVAGGADVAARFVSGQSIEQLQRWLLQVDQKFVERRIRWYEAALAKTELGQLNERLGQASQLAHAKPWIDFSQTIASLDELLHRL